MNSKPKTLVVWDFDLSMIDDNCDTYIFEQLAPHLSPVKLYRDEKKKNPNVTWTEVMDKLMHELFEKHQVTKADIERAFQNIPFPKESIAILELCKSRGCDMIIISNANEVFIDAILRVYKAENYFPKETIYTHPAVFEVSGRLKIDSYHGNAIKHQCIICPSYMCKGLVMKDFQAKYDRIFYVGDSTGDYCPCTMLSSNDHVMARRGHSLEAKINEEKKVKAKVWSWKDYNHMLDIFSKTI